MQSTAKWRQALDLIFFMCLVATKGKKTPSLDGSPPLFILEGLQPPLSLGSLNQSESVGTIFVPSRGDCFFRDKKILEKKEGFFQKSYQIKT